MQDSFLDFFLDLFFGALRYLMVLEHWAFLAHKADAALDYFLFTAGVRLLMETVFPWISSTVERASALLSSVVCGSVRLVAAFVKATLVAAFRIAYVHVVVVYLLVVAATVCLVRSLSSLTSWTLDFAAAAVVVVRFTVVSLALYLLASVQHVFSTAPTRLWPLAIITYQVATGFAIVPYIALVATAWAMHVLKDVLLSLLTATKQLASAAIVVVRFVIVTSATTVVARAADLLKRLCVAVCALSELIQRLLTCSTVAAHVMMSALMAVACHIMALLHAVRVVYWDRAFHTTDTSASWSCLCLLLVPTNLCEWSVVRFGVKMFAVKNKNTTAVPASAEADDEERATGDLLASRPESRSNSTAAWSLRLETRTVWMCEVSPVVCPMGAVSWARYPALSPVELPAPTPNRVHVEVMRVLARLSARALVRPPVTALFVPAVVASFLKAARDALLRDQAYMVRAVGAIMAFPGRQQDEQQGQGDEVQAGDDVRDVVQVGGVEAAMVIDWNMLLLPAREHEAVDPDDEPERQQQELPPQDQAEPGAVEQVPVDERAEIEEQPLQEQDNQNVLVEGLHPPVHEPVEVPLPLADGLEQRPEPPRVPGPRVAVRLPALRRAAVRPEGVGREHRVVQGGHARNKAHDGAERAAAHEPATIVVDHGFDYNRSPASRVLGYEETETYRARREASLAMRRKCGNVRLSPAASC